MGVFAYKSFPDSRPGDSPGSEVKSLQQRLKVQCTGQDRMRDEKQWLRDEADHAPRSAIEDADLSETSLGEVEDEKAHAVRKRVRSAFRC